MNNRRYKTPRSRQQAQLLPPSLDDYINEGNHVRAIDAYVHSLDLAAMGFLYADGKLTSGQPSYDPADLLKLYIYGYTNRVRSSRALEREAGRNLEVLWLLGELFPSHTTIADFRKRNSTALIKANKDFVLLCRELSLFGGKTVGIDGSFFQGNASKASIYTDAKLNRQITALEKDIAAWHEELDANDQQTQPNNGVITNDARLADKLEELQNKLVEKQQQKAQLKASGEGQLSVTDPDARLLKKRGQSLSGYNVQIAVDAKHKLLAASDITNEGNDSHQLSVMAKQVKAALEVDTLNCLADCGYYESEQLRQCEEEGVVAYVGIPDSGKRFSDAGRFSRDAFIYDEQQQVYRCPQGITLMKAERMVTINNKQYYRFRSTAGDCRHCAMRDQCLSKKGQFREIYRWEHEAVLVRHRERMEATPGAMRERSALAEHPFGTLKRRSGWDHFLVRGIDKVRGEWSLMALCYNMTRVLNIIGMKQFITHCQEARSMAI